MKENKMQRAVQMVLMDAIQHGLTTANEAIEYMKTETFKKQVKNYYNMLVKI